MSTTSSGQIQRIPLADLRLDPDNPRLPPEMQGGGHSQRDIALYINQHYDPLKIAESIAEHGFFESEALIAVPSGNGDYTAVEGNRRLTALMGLDDPSLRQEFANENSGWRRLPHAQLPETLPVVVVEKSGGCCAAPWISAHLRHRTLGSLRPSQVYCAARSRHRQNPE
ncbi:hypothetical protein G5V59_12075 [Nocardioides sp. W3-2-3]|uniref:hypothetical protein n=1 Tax=Nocardioides convexus TaxID=2712224 RepID=UPI00241855D9|nr:hypothetical protein [Nocardioides convexus]NHA00513.1 hypothetical protein [Nocardioides convexus]